VVFGPACPALVRDGVCCRPENRRLIHQRFVAFAGLRIRAADQGDLITAERIARRRRSCTLLATSVNAVRSPRISARPFLRQMPGAPPHAVRTLLVTASGTEKKRILASIECSSAVVQAAVTRACEYQHSFGKRMQRLRSGSRALVAV